VVPTANWGGAGDRDRMLFGGSKLYVFDVARVEGLSAFGGGREDCKIKQGRKSGASVFTPTGPLYELPVHRNRVAGKASCIGCARASMLLKPSRARRQKRQALCRSSFG
jgi:hypothetical protein